MKLLVFFLISMKPSLFSLLEIVKFQNPAGNIWAWKVLSFIFISINIVFNLIFEYFVLNFIQRVFVWAKSSPERKGIFSIEFDDYEESVLIGKQMTILKRYFSSKESIIKKGFSKFFEVNLKCNIKKVTFCEIVQKLASFCINMQKKHSSMNTYRDLV